MSAAHSRSRQRRTSLTPSSGGKPANSPASSTASVIVAPLDGQVSPVSSFGKRTQDFFALESGNNGAELDSEGCKESVTVTVRFRPLRQDVGNTWAEQA